MINNFHIKAMTRGPDKQFDPDVALEKAMRLFWAKGYSATGINELLEVMKIGRKSLYDTFKSKRALYIESLRLYSQTIVSELHRKLNDPDRPALENVSAVLHEIAAKSAEPMSIGCLLGVSMAQCRTDDREMAELLRIHMQHVENAFYSAFARAQAEGALKPTTDIRNLARLFMSSYQGLALIGRVTETQEVPIGIAEGTLAALENA